MPKSTRTKCMIAKGVKKLLETVSFGELSVGEICKQCQTAEIPFIIISKISLMCPIGFLYRNYTHFRGIVFHKPLGRRSAWHCVIICRRTGNFM